MCTLELVRNTYIEHCALSVTQQVRFHPPHCKLCVMYDGPTVVESKWEGLMRKALSSALADGERIVRRSVHQLYVGILPSDDNMSPYPAETVSD